MAYIQEQGVIYAEYQIPVTTTSGSTSYPIVFEDDQSLGRIIAEAEGCDVDFGWGFTSAVTASGTVNSTTKLLPNGNFSVTNSMALAMNVQKPSQNGANVPTTVYVAVQTPSGSGTAKIKLVRI